MRNFGAKLLIIPFLAFNALAANASIYKYTFTASNFSDANENETMDAQGDLSGFFILDTTQINGDSNYSAQNVESEIALPAWITQVSLTFTPDAGSGNESYTRTNTSESAPIDLVFWELSNPATFDPSAELLNQMVALSFGNGSRFSTAAFAKAQQYTYRDASNNLVAAEFDMAIPVNSVQVPGPLPLLGLIPFGFYFRKLKSSLKKN